MPAEEIVLMRQQNRYRLLRRFYEEVEGRTSTPVDFWAFAKQEGLSPDEAEDALDYLTDEGLVEPVAMGGLRTLSHAGRREVEASVRSPATSTPHFPGTVIATYHFHETVGVVQTGASSTARTK